MHGEPAVRSLADIPERVDLAYIMVPTHRVYSIVEEAAAVGIPNLVILTAGFGEVGETGAQLEREVLALAQQLGDRLEALEINSLLVHGSAIEALDVLITWNG